MLSKTQFEIKDGVLYHLERTKHCELYHHLTVGKSYLMMFIRGFLEHT